MEPVDLFTVHAADCCYVLDASSQEALSDDEYETAYPDDAVAVAGSVDMSESGAFVNTLGGRGGDERVDLIVMRLSRPLHPAEEADKKQFNQSFVEFRLRCDHGIAITTIEGEHQGVVVDKGGDYWLQLYMRLLDEPLRDNGPLEHHQLVVWPT